MNAALSRMRVTHYQATAYNKSTGSSHTGVYPFTEAQASEVGGVLELGGLNIISAYKLIDKWNRLGGARENTIIFSYCILTTDQLQALDSE